MSQRLDVDQKRLLNTFHQNSISISLLGGIVYSTRKPSELPHHAGEKEEKRELFTKQFSRRMFPYLKHHSWRLATGNAHLSITSTYWSFAQSIVDEGCYRHWNRHAPRDTRKRNVRSKIWWFTEFCNSHYVSHFAAFFIVTRAKTSIVESYFFIMVVLAQHVALTPHVDQFHKLFRYVCLNRVKWL